MQSRARPHTHFAGKVKRFSIHQIIFICLVSLPLIQKVHVHALNLGNTLGPCIQTETRKDCLSLSSPCVWLPCRVSHLCVCVRERGGGRKRLTSSGAPSDFIPFSLLLVHEHSKNTVGLLSPVCLYTLASIFTHLGATQMPRGGVRVEIIVIVVAAVWNFVK